LLGKTTVKTSKRLPLIGVAILFASLLFATFESPKDASAASPGDVIINELMYKPVSGDTNDEYLELYNTTGAPIDLENWCFSAGITLVTSYTDTACFEVGTTIAANGYLLVSPDIAQTSTTYSQTAVASYVGTSLANGGETVTLIDNTDAEIDTVSYDDANPWPASPDGDGPSLELKDPNTDNSVAASWGASVGAPTPGAENSWVSLTLPTITSMTDPNDVAASTAVPVTANLTDADSAQLTYKINFDADVVLTMFDDGLHDDGASDDGTYGASIPGQVAGTLVRLKVAATNTDGTIASPSADDSISYHGYYVAPTVTSNVPILEWFMPDAEYTDMVENHDFDDQEFDAVFVYDNEVFDSAKIWVKGGVKRVFDKKSFAVDLPAGYTLQLPGMDRSVDEFHLDSDFIDASGVAVPVAWQIAKEQGMDVPDVLKVRMQQNGEFFGVYTFLEEYDGVWRRAFNYNKGAFYKTNTLKTNIVIDPVNDLELFRQNLAVPPSTDRRAYMLDNLDIPNMLNYMAYMAIIHNWEWQNGKNMNKFHDVNDTGRWQVLPQDIDGTMVTALGGSAGAHPVSTLITPFDNSGFEIGYNDRFQFMSLYQEEDFREMYFRRLRTMVDEYYSNDRYLTLLQDQFDLLQPEIVQDNTKWSTWYGPPTSAKERIELQYAETKEDMLVRFRQPWAVPTVQSTNPVVTIETVNASPGNEAQEYIMLTNNTAESIDLSGWKLTEIGYTIPHGSVLLAGGSAFLVKQDLAYTVANSGTYILGQYTNSLNDNLSGTLTLLRVDDTESGSKAY
jgi:hypothetical protein